MRFTIFNFELGEAAETFRHHYLKLGESRGPRDEHLKLAYEVIGKGLTPDEVKARLQEASPTSTWSTLGQLGRRMMDALRRAANSARGASQSRDI